MTTLTLSKKMMFLMISIGIVSLVSIGYINYEHSRNVITTNIQNQLESESETHGAAVRVLLETRMEQNDVLASEENIKSMVAEYEMQQDADPATLQQMYHAEFHEQIRNFEEGTGYSMALSDAIILDDTGDPIFTLSSEYSTHQTDHAYYRMLTDNGRTFVELENKDGFTLATISQVTSRDTGMPIGALITRTSASAINDLLASSGLGDDGEVYMTNRNGEIISQLKFPNNSTSNATTNSKAVTECFEEGARYAGIYTSYWGEEMYGTAYCAQDLGIIVVAEIDTRMVKEPLQELQMQMQQAGAIIIGILGGLAILVAKTISKPLRRLRDMAGQVAGGNFDVKSEIGRKDEIGELADEFDTMTRRLKESMTSILERDDVIKQQEGVLLQFSDRSENYCVGMIDIISSTKTCAQLDDAQLGEFYKIFINSMGHIVQKYEGTVVKNIGDALLFCFPIYGHDRKQILGRCIDCCINMCEIHDNVGKRLKKAKLPPLNYRISATYGVVKIAKSSTSLVEDIFGSTVNTCSKINRSAPVNGVIIDECFYAEVKDFPEYEFEEVHKDTVMTDHGYTGFVVTKKTQAE